MEDCFSGVANLPLTGANQNVSVCGSVNDLLLTLNVSQPGELLKAVVSGVATSVLEEGPSAGARLQPPALDAGTLSPAEVCLDDTIRVPIPVGSTTLSRSMPLADDAPSVTARCEPGPSRCGLDPALHNPTSLPATLATFTKRVDTPVSFESRNVTAASQPSHGTSDAVITGFPDQRTGSHPSVVVQGRSDVPRTTLSNLPSAHIPEQIFHVQTLRPNELDDFPPDRPMSSETGDDGGVGVSGSGGWTGQPSAAAVEATPSPTPTRVHPPVANLNPPELMGELGREHPLTATSSEEDILDHLLHTSASLPDVTHIADQAGGPVELHPHPVPKAPPQTVEQSIPLINKEATEVIEEPAASPAEKSISPAAKDSITPVDEVRNSVPAEEMIALALVVSPTAEPTRESIPPDVEDPVTLADEISNSSAANRVNSQVIEESDAPHFPFTPTNNPRPPSCTQTAGTAVNAPDNVSTLVAFGVAETASLIREGQDEEDELIVDAILTSSPDSGATPQPPPDTVDPKKVTTQEKDKNSGHTAIPQVVTASATGTEPGLNPNPSNSAIDTPSTVRKPQPYPVFPQEAITPTPSGFPRSASGVTVNAPLSKDITPESTTPASLSVLKTFWSGALQELTMAKNSLQHVFATPLRPSPGPPLDGSPGTAPSSPIIEGGFWDPGTGATHGEPQTDFVRACRNGHSSSMDSQSNEELRRPTDLRRKLSLQQGTGTPLMSYIYASHNPQCAANLSGSVYDKSSAAPAPEESVNTSAVGPSVPGRQTSKEGPPHIIHPDTMTPGLSGGDRGSVQYWGRSERPTLAQQFSWLTGTPTPGPPFQPQPGERRVNGPFGHREHTLSNVDEPLVSRLGSTNFTQPTHVSGNFTIGVRLVL